MVDEAGQCVEPSTLIALRRGCKRCILVGDPKQLSATTFSTVAARTGYSRSLLERLMHGGHPTILLDTQYRMNPFISAFPSRMFYRGKLMDGPNVSHKTYRPAYIAASCAESVSDAVAVVPPVMFLDVTAAESKGSSSRSNMQEVHMCLRAVLLLIREAVRRNNGQIGSIGIITPYMEQLVLMRKTFRQAGLLPGVNICSLLPKGSPYRAAHMAAAIGSGSGGDMDIAAPAPQCFLDIELNTVDAFQGREKDVVVISCVRGNGTDTGSIGFLSDIRRMNVALTRAKHALIVVGNANTLQSNHTWSQFLTHNRDAGTLFHLGASGEIDLCSVLGALQRKKTQAQAQVQAQASTDGGAEALEEGQEREQEGQHAEGQREGEGEGEEPSFLFRPASP